MTKRRTDFAAIGTTWSILINDSVSDERWAQLLDRIHQRIEQFDKVYSRFRPDSLVTIMSQRSGDYRLPKDAHRMLQFYERLYDVTDGLVTPLIGQTMSDAGYDANYSLQPRPLTSPPAWSKVISYDKQTIRLKRPAMLDFGAAGKGYLVDIVGGIIAKSGFKEYMIDASGDILHHSSKDKIVEIGLENPTDTSTAIGVVRLSNKSLCASSGARRQWGKYTHILNPKSLESPSEILASWVIADDTMAADGLATALFFVPGQALEQFKFEYAVLYKDMTVASSHGFPVKWFQVDKK